MFLLGLRVCRHLTASTWREKNHTHKQQQQKQTQESPQLFGGKEQKIFKAYFVNLNRKEDFGGLHMTSKFTAGFFFSACLSLFTCKCPLTLALHFPYMNLEVFSAPGDSH